MQTLMTDFMATADNREIKKQWELFQAGEKVSGVRPSILASWKRCREMGVHNRRLAYKKLPQDEFAQVLREESDLLEVASPILDRIRETLRLHDCLLNLANRNGVALRSWIGKTGHMKILPGHKVDEKSCGTVGLSLCLPSRESVVVYGAEHYSACLHDLVCIASPIIDVWGKLLGGVSISCPLESFHPWSLTFMQEAAINISEQLRLRDALATSEALIENFAEGVLMINRNTEILQINRNGRALLELGDSPLPAQLGDMLDEDFLEKLRQWRPFSNEEARINHGKGKSAACLATFRPSERGGMLNIKNIRGMYGYVAKTAGINACYNFHDIRGNSPALRSAVQTAGIYATADAPVLILGESGTGKELFAQSIHNASSRHNKPFVVVNCGALPRELVQSELFGYAPGAFTGARKQGNPGKFELAEEGTIFLDEIGEMELEAQASLLRFLQSGEVTRLGDTISRKVNVRVIAATNRDLYEAIEEGRFRKDLFHRLNVFALTIPPLRERLNDIPELAQAVLNRLAQRHPHFHSYSFSDEAIAEFLNYPWPGNVRELEHTVERILFMAREPIIRQADVLLRSPAAPASVMGQPGDEKQLLTELLKKHRGNVLEVARECGVSKTTLYVKLNQHQLNAKSFRQLSLAPRQSSNHGLA